MKRLDGKTAVVSGAASGIGRASALLFAKHGANVVVLDRAPAVEDTAAAIRSAGGKVIAFTISLISASLPVTGFLVWRGRHKQRKPHRQPLAVAAA